MSDHPARSLAIDGIKAAPVAAVGVSHWLMQVDWQPIVLMMTALYTLFLLVEKVWKFWKWARAKRAS